jgi:tripartite-type tricarboxylate transporter receptor subunit TctC
LEEAHTRAWSNAVKLPRRRFLNLAAAVAALPVCSRLAYAADYPTRPVHLLVGFTAGGPLDVAARLIAQRLSERLGQQFIVDNRPGASSNIAAAEVARAAPDGYTLLMCAAANAWNVAFYHDPGFDFLHDIAPVASFARVGGVLEVNLSVPARTVPEFIAYAKDNPGKVNLASAGPGSAPGLWGELFKSMARVDLVTVNYRGSGPALPDLMAGRVQAMFDVVTTALGPVRAGKVRGLAVTTAERMDVLPALPSIGESVPGYEATAFQGIGAPKGTPAEIVAILNKEVNAALVDPTFKARLISLGAQPFASSPAEFGKFLSQYTDKWGKVIHAAGLKVE